MWAPLLPKAPTSEIETGLYTEAFAAILADHGPPAPMSAPVEERRTVRVRRETPSDDARHLPTLKAAALGWLLLLSTGAASWYAIVDPIWSTPITIPSPVTASLIIGPSTRSLLAIESEIFRVEAERAAAAADDWVFATIDPILPRPSEIGVETAAASTAATVPPPQTTHKPAPDLIASLVETAPNAPTSSHRLPKDTIGVRPGDDPAKPVTGRNGEAKGSTGNPFVGLYPGKPQSGSPSITTASRAGTGASQSEDPHPGGGAPSDTNQGHKESKSDKPGLGGSAAPGGPKAGKDKPSASESAPAGPQDKHNSNGGKPSPGKADHNRKGDADKKDKPGKDKGDKAKGKDPH